MKDKNGIYIYTVFILGVTAVFINFRTKIVLNVIIITTIVLSFFSILFYFLQKKKIEEKVNIFVQQIGNAKVKESSQWFKRAVTIINMISYSDEVRSMKQNNMKRYLKNAEESSADIYKKIFVADLKGNIINYKQGERSINIGDREYFKNIVTRGSKLEISAPVISKSINESAFIIAVPITDNSNKLVGVTGGIITLTTISKMVAEINLKGSGFAWIVDRKGTVIAHPNPQYPLKVNIFMAEKVGIPEFSKLAKKIVSGKQGFGKYSDKGIKKYVVYMPIPESKNFIFALTLYEDMLYKEINKRMCFFVFGVILIVATIAFLVRKASKKLTKPIVELTKAVRRFEEEQKEFQIEIESGDELEELGNSFNKMVKTITNHTSELEKIIAEKIDALHEVNRILLAKNSELEYLNDNLAEKNSDLYKLATMDSLTSLFNRFELFRRIETLIPKCRRDKEYKFSVIMLDLDNFKFYNDKFGHDIGDELLRVVALFLRENLRENDVIARYGGDEFVIVVEKTGKDAVHIAEKLLREMAARRGFLEELSLKYRIEFEVPPEKFLMCSMGVYEYDSNNEEKSAKEIIKKVDEALYMSKRSGKGMVTVINKSGS